jgi:hypothetical protein
VREEVVEMRTPLFLCAVFVLATCLGTGHAAIPQTMSYQGVVKNAAGVPLVSQPVVLVFEIFDDPAAGATVWGPETHDVTTDANGIVSVVLGSVVPIDIDFADPYWLEVTVEGTTLTPRVELTSCPYAFQAAGIEANVVSSVNGVANDEGDIDLVAGSNITITPDDLSNTITISASGGGGGDITAVYADDGLTGTTTSGDAHISVGAGDGLDISADAVAVDVTDVAGGGLGEDGANNLQVNTGTGLQVSGDAVSLTSAYSSGSAYDSRFVNEGQAGSVTTTMIVPSVVSSVDGVFNDGGNIDLVAGSNMTITPNDGANTITFSATGGGGIGGSGTTSYIPKMTASTTIGNSIMYENGGTIYIAGSSLRKNSDYEVDAKDGGDFTRNRNPAQLHVEGIDTWTIYADVVDADGYAGEAAIYGYRSGSHDGVGYGVYSTNNAVIGYSYWGNPYTFGVSGYTYGDYSNCGGVFGSDYSGSYWGSLGYKDTSSKWWGVYTPRDAHVGGDVHVDGRIGIGTTPYAALDVYCSGLYDAAAIRGDGTGGNFALEVHNNSGTGGAFFSRTTPGSPPGSDVAAIYAEAGPGAYGGYMIAAGDDYKHTLALLNDGNGCALWASGTEAGFAGYFYGDVHVNGTLTGGKMGSKVDHPLDPANKYLSHVTVESSEMTNVYSGNVVLDDAGAAWVNLPEWFEALNSDYRYQLTAIGAPAPDLYVAQEISDNTFRIGGGEPGMKVSWHVTGLRNDPFADANRTPVEEMKGGDEVGKYMHPELYELPETMSIDYERRASLPTD